MDTIDWSADYPDSDDGEQILHPDDDTANWWFGRKKHKKHKKHRKKHHKYRFWKKHRSDLKPDDTSSQSQHSGDLIDFNDIKNRIPQNQQEDINTFIRNVNSAPQRFDFDVDAFVAKNRIDNKAAKVAAIVSKEVVPERSFYQFRPDTNWADQTQSISLSKLSNPSEKRSRRDILTQHLKAIANKIHLYPAMKNDPFGWTYLPQSLVSMDKKQRVNPTGNSGDEEDNTFIDHFYLLNDGKAPADPFPKKKSAALADLALDLDLDRKFRDLKTFKNSAFYSAEQDANFNQHKLP